MAMVISTNTASISAQRHLHESRKDLDVAMERLSSGQRINSAADDSAGLAIRDKMTSQIGGLNQAVRNANDAISMSQSAEGGLAESTQILHRMRTLAMQASNDTNTASDRANLNDELTDLQAELTRIAETATFNNQNLLEGTMSSSTFQIGHKAGETIALTIADMSADSIGKGAVQFTLSVGAAADALTIKIGDDVSATYTAPALTGATSTVALQAAAAVSAFNADADFTNLYTATNVAAVITITAKANSVINTSNVTFTSAAADDTLAAGTVTESGTFLSAISVTTRTNASDAVAVIDYALDLVSKERANLGAFQNRLEHAVSNMMNMSANTADARSVVADADYAQESSALAKNQILQQAGTAMLAQANAQSQTVLSLLK
jgi:flagellin